MSIDHKELKTLNRPGAIFGVIGFLGLIAAVVSIFVSVEHATPIAAVSGSMFVGGMIMHVETKLVIMIRNIGEIHEITKKNRSTIVSINKNVKAIE